MLKNLAVATALCGLLASSAPTSSDALPFFNNATVFTPPSSWTDKGTSYGRTLLLDQDCERGHVMLSTFTVRPPTGAYLPIMESLNGGQTWQEISQATFKAAKGTGSSIAQPHLFELPEQFGNYPAGTVLLAGNAIPADRSSTNIEIHASLDKGYTWEYVSTVVSSGPPNTANGAPCVWEPFMYMYDGQLIVYYSDQRDPKHGQKLAHQTSTNLKKWGPVVNDVAYANYTLRPGMATVSQIGNGQFMLSHELGFAPEDPVLAPYAVHYQIADSPMDFGPAPKKLLQATDGTIPSSCPYTVWTPTGGANGTIVLSDGVYGALFLNTKNGDPSAWDMVSSGHGVGYSRALRVMPDESVVLVYNGGMYGDDNTIVTNGDFRVPGPESGKDTISVCDSQKRK